MAKKRTFGDLKPGSYFWRAVPGSVNRTAVKSISHVDADTIRILFSYYSAPQSTNKASRAIENEPTGVYWYVDKKDAQKKAIELQQKAIKDMELQLSRMYRELGNLKAKWGC